jgi:hypothetical protein
MELAYTWCAVTKSSIEWHSAKLSPDLLAFDGKQVFPPSCYFAAVNFFCGQQILAKLHDLELCSHTDLSFGQQSGFRISFVCTASPCLLEHEDFCMTVTTTLSHTHGSYFYCCHENLFHFHGQLDQSYVIFSKPLKSSKCNNDARALVLSLLVSSLTPKYKMSTSLLNEASVILYGLIKFHWLFLPWQHRYSMHWFFDDAPWISVNASVFCWCWWQARASSPFQMIGFLVCLSSLASWSYICLIMMMVSVDDRWWLLIAASNHYWCFDKLSHHQSCSYNQPHHCVPLVLQ